MSKENEKVLDFWEQSFEEILNTDDDVFIEQLKRFYKREFINSRADERFMMRAIENAKSTVIILKLAEMGIRVSSLESANEFSFTNVALNLALSGGCGIMVGLLARKLISKLLAHRMTYLDVVEKHKVDISSLSATNLRALMTKSGYGKQAIAKHGFFRTLTGIKTHKKINLNPGSWESLAIEHVPNISSSRTDDFIQALRGRKANAKNTWKIKSPDILTHFNAQQDDLVEKIRLLELDYADFEFLIKSSHDRYFDGFLKREWIAIVKESVNFDKTIDNKLNLAAADVTKIMAQPFLLAALSSSFGVLPSNISPALDLRNTPIMPGPSRPIPERVATSPEYRDLLFKMAEYIFVPINNHGTPISFFDHYNGDKRTTTVALVRYLNKIREQRELRDTKRWVGEGIRIYEKGKSVADKLFYPWY